MNGEERLVMVDFGLDDEVFQNYYRYGLAK